MGGPDSVVELFLMPGEYIVGDEGYRIRTLLGSCVSITLWHPALRIGAMSHFLLASGGLGAACQQDARYGDGALFLMMRELTRVGVPLTQCQAKIFGGGNMFPQHLSTVASNVGQKNGETAHALLRSQNIPVVSEHLYGDGHRQIIFDIFSGDVWSRQIKPCDSISLPERRVASGFALPGKLEQSSATSGLFLARI